MPRTSLPALALLAALCFTDAAAQTAHDHAAMHATETAGADLTEPGQGAFAAISEVVALLRADPGTNWEMVDIGALRRHLVDMDDLVTHATVETLPAEHGLELRILLSGPGGAAAKRMVPAHAPVLAAETGWESTASVEEQVIVWRVTDRRDAAMIRALGFYGLMALGDHHREHHLALATGQMMH